jgi:T-complex protein 1 subunit gamma
LEEEYIKNLCAQILKFKPDLVVTEKGLSDLAIHYLSKAGVSAIRRLRKTDNNRIAKACGAVIVNRPEELQESDVGTRAGLFEVKKIGDEFFSFIIDCQDPKACTVLLRGASKDVLNEVERNLQVYVLLLYSSAYRYFFTVRRCVFTFVSLFLHRMPCLLQGTF